MNEIKQLENVVDREVLEAERVIHERLEWLHIVNDYCSAVTFLVGSILFLYAKYQTAATWLFIVGSVFFLIGPILRTFNKHYVKHYNKAPIHW